MYTKFYTCFLSAFRRAALYFIFINSILGVVVVVVAASMQHQVVFLDVVLVVVVVAVVVMEVGANS